MPGHKYKCDACGITLWMVKKARCVSCGGHTSPMPSNVPQKSSCAVCGCEFKPRDARQNTCSPECSNANRKARAAVRSEKWRAKERKESAGGRAAAENRKRQKRTWKWMETCVDEYGLVSARRTILRTLADKTEANDWPYPDVLAGAGPCLIDEYPFL